MIATKNRQISAPTIENVGEIMEMVIEQHELDVTSAALYTELSAIDKRVFDIVWSGAAVETTKTNGENVYPYADKPDNMFIGELRTEWDAFKAFACGDDVAISVFAYEWMEIAHLVTEMFDLGPIQMKGA